MIDDHAHPWPLEPAPLDLAALSLDVSVGPDADAHRRAVGPTRLALEQLTTALAALLGCAPDEAVATRDRLALADWGGWVRRLWADAGITATVLDGGPERVGVPGLAALSASCGVPTWELLRVEAVVDPLVAGGAGVDEVLAAVDAAFDQVAGNRVVGAKTVLAYRTGLAVDPTVTRRDAADALRADTAAGVPVARRAKPLRDLVLLRVLERCGDAALPLQVHTGFGDSDIRAADANPLLLDDVLRSPAGRAARVVLIHGSWPWHEEAAYLASVLPGVYVELSLANLFSPATCADRLLRLLDMAPAARLLVGTDGHGPPESHWFAARTAASAWEAVRDRLAGTVRESWLDDVAHRLFEATAEDLYRLA